jgi:hypothetical protein
METIVPFSTENAYLATEFVMKEPYKNTRLLSLLEKFSRHSRIIYDNGVIRGILAVDSSQGEMWFYGNRKSFKSVMENTEMNKNSILYIDSKNLDIVQSKFQFKYFKVSVMRLKIRDYPGGTRNAGKIERNEPENCNENPGDAKEYKELFVKRNAGEIESSVKVLSCNIKTCSIGCLNYREGEEENIYDILSSIVNEYKPVTENIIIYLPLNEELKAGLMKFGFTYTGELLKLYDIQAIN